MDIPKLRKLLQSGTPGAKGRATSASLDKEFAFYAGDHARLSLHNELVNAVDIRRGTGDVATLIKDALPRERSKINAKAREWYDTGDDLLHGLIKIKREFTALGYTLQPQPKPDGDNKDVSADSMSQVQTILKECSHSLHYKKVIEDLITDWYVNDSCILHWKVDTTQDATGLSDADSVPAKLQEVIPGLQYVGTIDPADVDWFNSLGVNKLFVNVPEELANRIRVALAKNEPERSQLLQELRNEGIGQKWIDAVDQARKSYKDHPDKVELKNEDGEYWIIRTAARQHYGLAVPSMFTIFLALETRRMICDGEFAAAFMMKHFIQHILVGESIGSGPLAGLRDNWASDEDCSRILSQFVNVQKTMRICTNHTVKIQFVFPPKEMFDLDKFLSSERRILRWAGVSLAIVGGEKQTTAEGFIGIKRTLADIETTRTLTSDMTLEFFRHPSIRERVKLPLEFDAICQYDQNVLKDPKQLLDEVRFLVEGGMGDPEMALRELGRDPEATRASKTRSIQLNENSQVYEPVWNRFSQSGFGLQPQDGRDGGQQGGRPPNPGTPRSEETRLQGPTNIVPD